MKLKLIFDSEDNREEMFAAVHSKDSAYILWYIKHNLYQDMCKYNETLSEEYKRGVRDAINAILKKAEDIPIDIMSI